MVEGFGDRKRENGGRVFERRPVLGGRAARRRVDLHLEEEMAFSDDARRWECPMSQRAQRRRWRFEAQLFSELAGGRIGGVLARFDQSCRKLPKHAVVAGR